MLEKQGVSFAHRTLEHVKCYLRGLYRIYDPHQFAKGKKILIWGGMWKPNRKDPDTMYEYLTQYQRLFPLSYEFLNQFRIFLAPIDEDNQRIRQRVEAAIAFTLREHDGVVGSFQDTDIKYWARRPQERPITENNI
jgi:hypothetical protein